MAFNVNLNSKKGAISLFTWEAIYLLDESVLWPGARCCWG